MIYIGIDPGVTGGTAAITESGEIVYLEAFVRYKTFKLWIDERRLLPNFKCQAHLEESTLSPLFNPKTKQMMPRKGAQEFARNLGGWIATLEILDVSHELIKPQKWQKKILGDIPKGETKPRAHDFAVRKWPLMNLRKKDSGIIDALCIAWYGRMMHIGSLI